jgi:hypothetical protein
MRGRAIGHVAQRDQNAGLPVRHLGLRCDHQTDPPPATCCADAAESDIVSPHGRRSVDSPRRDAALTIC